MLEAKLRRAVNVFLVCGLSHMNHMDKNSKTEGRTNPVSCDSTNVSTPAPQSTLDRFKQYKSMLKATLQEDDDLLVQHNLQSQTQESKINESSSEIVKKITSGNTGQPGLDEEGLTYQRKPSFKNITPVHEREERSSLKDSIN